MARRARALTSPLHLGPSEVATLCVQLVPGGTVLPSSRLLGPAGFPVVLVDEDAHRARVASGEGPLRSFDEVAAALYDGSGVLPASAVSFAAFVSTSPASVAVRELRGVRAYCRAIALVADDDVPGEPLLSEFDYYGITVASVAQGRVRVHVLGDAGRAPGSDLAVAWSRHREEQLYAAALRLPRGLRPSRAC